MTNYEKLFQEQMQNPEFAKAYYDSKIERIFNDLLENLKEKIANNEPKEILIETIDNMQHQFA